LEERKKEQELDTYEVNFYNYFIYRPLFMIITLKKKYIYNISNFYQKIILNKVWFWVSHNNLKQFALGNKKNQNDL